MEESRLILALVLSFVVFMLWFFIFTPKQDEKTEEAQKQNPAQTQPSHTITRKTTEPDLNFQPIIKQSASVIDPQRMARTITIKTPLYNISLSEQGASIIDMTLNHFCDIVVDFV